MRRSRPLAVALISLVLAAGCTSTDRPEPDPTTQQQSEEDTAAVDDALEEMHAGAGERVEPVPLEAELPALATRSTVDGDTPLEVDLNGVRISGELMTVVFSVRNLDDSSWYPTNFFDDGSTRAPLDEDSTRGEEGGMRLGWTTDGVTVVDPVNSRVYRAAYDTAGHCLCSSNLNARQVGTGQSVVLTTAFAAPPEDVTEVTVQIPGAGSFDGVPLTR